MGICCRAKEIICSSRVCDVPVFIEENKQNNMKIKDGVNNNSISNDNNKNININNENNKNHQTSNETAQKLEELTKEEKNKQIDIKDSSKNIDGKKSNEENEEKKTKNSKARGSKKKVGFAHKQYSTEMNTEENTKTRKRGHSIMMSHKKVSNYNINNYKENEKENGNENENENENDNNNNDDTNNENNNFRRKKFERNKKKCVTLIDKNFKLSHKLRGVEMKIPVIQETLVTQKFGDPSKYYKKIKDLGSGSYGSVYQAKNIVLDNIVAIKVIEKVEDNMVDLKIFKSSEYC